MDSAPLVGGVVGGGRRGQRGCMLVVPCGVGVVVVAGTCLFGWCCVLQPLPSLGGAGGAALQTLFALGGATLAALCLWALAAAAATHPGTPPPLHDDEWLRRPAYAHRARQHEHEQEQHHEQQHVQVHQRDLGSIRYCKHCRTSKPDRTHHCRVLGQCVLRFDHHCPWVGNTVGWKNQKVRAKEKKNSQFFFYAGFSLVFHSLLFILWSVVCLCVLLCFAFDWNSNVI